MNALRRPEGLRAAYGDEPWTTRVHTAVRWATAPLDRLADELPDRGRILEIGCGHGLFCLLAAQGSADRVVVGADVDAAKLVEARRAAGAAGLGTDRLEFRDVPFGWRPSAEGDAADAIVILDVLYLLGHDEALDLVRAAAKAVRPGGVLLVKEMDTAKRLKSRFTSFQEFLATKVTSVTEGEELELVPLDDIAVVMADEGLSVSIRALDRGMPWPHALVAGNLRHF